MCVEQKKICEYPSVRNQVDIVVVVIIARNNYNYNIQLLEFNACLTAHLDILLLV